MRGIAVEAVTGSAGGRESSPRSNELVRAAGTSALRRALDLVSQFGYSYSEGAREMWSIKGPAGLSGNVARIGGVARLSIRQAKFTTFIDVTEHTDGILFEDRLRSALGGIEVERRKATHAPGSAPIRSLPLSGRLPLREQSDLAALGYNVSTLSRVGRLPILRAAVKRLGRDRVAAILRSHIRLRSGSAGQRARYRSALTEWRYDLSRLPAAEYRDRD